MLCLTAAQECRPSGSADAAGHQRGIHGDGVIAILQMHTTTCVFHAYKKQTAEDNLTSNIQPEQGEVNHRDDVGGGYRLKPRPEKWMRKR